MNTIPLLKVFVAPDLDKPLLDVLHSGYIGEGPKVKEFEAALVETFKFPRVLTVNSCTSALQLALRLAGVGHGDVVLSTPATNMATNSVILALGATPYWVDVDPFTGRVDPARLPKDLPKNTKALVVMDWGGVSCDMFELMDYADRRGIKVVEDAAHGLGGTYRQGVIGQFADFTCFSFQAVKHLTTGDGGALVCKDPADHERGRLLRWFGIDRDNPTKQADLRCEAPIHDFGYKMHMNDIAATIGLANLKYFPDNLARIRSNADFYTNAIVDMRQEPILNYLDVHPFTCPSDRLPTYWLYTLVISQRRDVFAEYLRNKGVACSKVHSRNDEHPCMPKPPLPLPGVDEWYRTQLSIPVGWWVTDEDRAYVVKIIREAAEAVL
jgi:perosamine synthetase